MTKIKQFWGFVKSWICSQFIEAFYFWHVISLPLPHSPNPCSGKKSFPYHAPQRLDELLNLAPTSLDIFMLFLLPESGGGPRTLDPKAIWQTSWFLLFRTLPVPLLMNWSVLFKEGNNSPLIDKMTNTMLQCFSKCNPGVIWFKFQYRTLIKNADTGAQHQIYQICRIRILGRGGRNP